MNPLDALVERLRTKAAGLGWEVDSVPENVLQPRKSGSQSRVPASQPAQELRTEAMFIGPQAMVMLGSLDPAGESATRRRAGRAAFDDDVVRNRWAYFQRRAASARTLITQERHDELLLMLAGPAGSAVSSPWLALAAEAERHDLICRKLIWLPPAKERDWDISLNDFVSRTFLTRPWCDPVASSIAPALDELTKSGVSLRGWEGVLDAAATEESVDYQALIVRLIETYAP